MLASLPATLLLDFDGTLADSQPAIVATVQHTFALQGMAPPDPAAIRQIIGYGLGKGFAILAPELSPEAIQACVTIYRQHYPKADEQTQLYPGARELLATVKQRGIPMILVSNKTETALLAALERLGILSYFDHVFGEIPGQPLKPDPALYHTKIHPYAGDPQSNLLVGDTPTDIRFAQNLGMPVVWASFGYGSATDCLPLQPTYTVSSLVDLKNFFVERGC